jgi:hypothetical protein
MYRFLTLWLIAFCCLPMGAGATDLVEQKVQGFDRAQVLPAYRLNGANTIYIATPKLFFNKQWLNDYSRNSSATERAKLAAHYCTLMDKILRERLIKRGWLIRDAPGQNTLTLSTQLNDFYINAPDFGPVISKNFVRVAGHARVAFELTQADGSSLAHLSDFSETSEKPGGKLALTNRGMNHWDFQYLMQRWSDRLEQYLANNVQ